MKKRIFSMFLIMLMVLSIFPQSTIVHAAAETSSGVRLETLEPSASERYTGNMGDSFIEKLGTKNGFVDVNDNKYTYGLEAWVARWNFKDELSWVWNEYQIDGRYSTLTGFISLIKSYNTTNFKTQFDIIGDGNVLFSTVITPSTLPVNINVNLTGISTLKIYLHDTVGAAGGTSFGLIDFTLDNPTPSTATTIKPVANKVAKTYTDSVKVKLTSVSAGAKIYYTTNGKDPSLQSKSIASGKTVTISKTATLKFMAVAPGYRNSPVVSAKYTIKTANPDKRAVPKSQKIKKGNQVKLTAPKGVTLYYTLDGKKPTDKLKTKVSAGNSKSIRITKNTTLKVIAKKSGCQSSSVVTRQYKLK